jgi:hypothetical protein
LDPDSKTLDPDSKTLEKELAKLSDLQVIIADTMIYEQKNLLTKCGSFLWQKAKAIGKSLMKTIIKSGKVKTSGERNTNFEKAKEEERILNNKRREILSKAIDVIKDGKNQSCLKLKAPIRLAIYGEVENDQGKLETIFNDQEQRPTHRHIVGFMQDVQARLGAQAVNSMINTKSFPDGLDFCCTFWGSSMPTTCFAFL